MKFPNGTPVDTPNGRGMVVDASNPYKRKVQFRDKEAGTRNKTFPIDKLKLATKPNIEALQAAASKNIEDQIKKNTKVYRDSSAQKQIKVPKKHN